MGDHEYIELQQLHETETRNTSESKWSLTKSQLLLILLRLGVISDEVYQSGNYAIHSLPKGVEYIIGVIDHMHVSEAVEILRNALVEHKNDVNFLQEDYHLLERLVHSIPSDDREDKANVAIEDDASTRKFHKNKTYLHIIDWSLQSRLEASLIHYHSPYPEIRAISDPVDDKEIFVDTFRCYFIGFFWTFIGSIINSFFVHRMPNISLSSHTIQILLLPCGKLWEKFVPNKRISFGTVSFDLNPGVWTYKEMMLSSIIYSCSAGVPYSIYNIFVMKLDRFYGLKWVTLTFQVLLTISTQFLGFGFAMIMKKVCVYPSRALWPTILPTIALNRALMNEDANNSVYGWKISRYMFFIVVGSFSFIYNWIPSYLFKALSNFNWPTWLDSSSIHLVNITGTSAGLGLNIWPTFDWNILDAGGCLTIPFYTYVNRYIGSLIGFVVILIVYYTNNYFTAYFPINSNKLYNNKAQIYDVHSILNEKNQFSNEKYQEVGPPYFSAANLVLYGANFCLYPFAILYQLVTEWDSMKASFVSVWVSISDAFRSKHSESSYGRYADDPHCKMMSQYEDVPDWWFIAILVVSTSFAIAAVVFYPTETPVWGIFFTILINFIFLIPLTSIASTTGFSFGLNVLVELIVGYAIPNSGIALITLKAFGYNIDSQASNYITDQKLAHYAKIPPKAIFKGQLISTLINIVVSLTVANWQLGNISDICDRHQKDKLSCPGANTYFYSSVQYGEIGPQKVFSGLYPVLKWCFLLGVLLVFPCVWFKNNGPIRLARYFQPSVLIGGFLDFAPYNLSYFTGGLYISYIFMYRIKRDYLLWWEKYNYILTSALSAGVAFSSLLIFFTVQYNSHEISWWGNTISEQGIEGGKLPAVWKDASAAPGGYVGLRKGHFP
ncbi:OPT family small oligopeptide transporter [Candida parapsilosis]|uniref:OPT family small oligopeptide transporter n=1 Tax=Candida parapsilosis TaxID=5480 RepID=A0A8X7NIV2_CANPA|nr:OPT family small oligopeptide transporter [Candida parapsilosis]KAF6047689.1 OPT family small oligopeptide transporter [Candida parapsilosis]KAF6050343.1 OPT family small oligopeptide transporter [Candida parapsilosis]KAF6061463.1 OPT family small oligopeptide transporter [Candida parapsilosis]